MNGFWMVVRLLVAGGIIWFLLSHGKLDLTLFLDGSLHFDILFVALLFNLILISIGAIRWRILLISQQIDLPFSWIHAMTYLTICFNLFIPGSVGGDAFRMAYVAKQLPERRGVAILTVFADRVIGLYGLLCLCLVGLLLNGSLVFSVTPLLIMTLSVAALVVGIPVLLLFFLFFLPRIPRLRAYVQSPPANRMGRMVAALAETLRLFMAAKGLVLLALLVSVVGQAMGVFSLAWIAKGLDRMVIPLEGFFVAAPLAWIANVLPISPGGLGVGEAAFDQLCHWLQPVETAAGFGSIFLINRIVQMVASLPGLGVYILLRQPKPSTSLHSGQK
ncbi:MAG: flippase-like domain-containing protein [Magnetococcales bacterium]|nr:flippase-like domain-containing protein [Magnetococcales bacterium]